MKLVHFFIKNVLMKIFQTLSFDLGNMLTKVSYQEDVLLSRRHIHTSYFQS